MIDHPSPNHGPRPPGRPIDLLIVHYTGMPTAAAALARMCDPAAQVSAHYMVDEDGTVYRLVPEERRAWHAGVGCWHGDRDVNSRSIGVELVNPGHEFGYRPFPEAQMAAFEALALDVMGRHGMASHQVLGHSDVACPRKEDPGELFDWPRLAAKGIGVWPEPGSGDDGPCAPGEVSALLEACGYDAAAAKALVAFQRHYRPERLDGIPDAETVRRVRALARARG